MFDPFEDIRRMHKEMDRMFRDFFSVDKQLLPWKNKQEFANFRQPSCDVNEGRNKVMVEIEIPGVKKEDIQLHVRDDVIEVKAERKQNIKIEKKGFFRQERIHSGFYRAIPLPAKIDVDNTTAEYKNGILRIEAPKKERLIERGKRIAIK